MAEIIVMVAQQEDGKYIAASASSPYFCFEADTEAAAKQKVEAALAVYSEVKRPTVAILK